MAGADIALTNAVLFSASPYLSKSTYYSGVSNSKSLTFGFWVRRVTTGSQHSIYGAGGGGELIIEFTSADKLRVRAESVGTSTTALEVTTATTFNDTSWHHILVTFDMANSGNRSIYVDDSADAATWATYTDTTLEWNVNQINLGSAVGGGTLLNADLAEFWLDYGTNIDFSTTANRRPFISATGKPGVLGGGAVPTGSLPTVYLSGDASEWYTNKGYGGGFTLNGTISNSVTSPTL